MSEDYLYEHPLFPSGTKVYVSENIREIHSASPVAGKSGIAKEGTIFKFLEDIGENQKSKVYVFFEGIGSYYIEEEYLSLEN